MIDESSPAFLKALIENLPDMIFVKEAKELRFVEFNRAGEEILGLRREEVIGKNDYDFFPKDQADFFTQKDRSVLRGYRVVDIPQEVITVKDGRQRILHTKKIPIVDEAGVPQFLLGVSEDITEKVNTDAQRHRLISEEGALAERELAARRNEFLAEAGLLLGGAADDRLILSQLAKLAVERFADGCTITLVSPFGKVERIGMAHRSPRQRNILRELESYFPHGSEKTYGIQTVLKEGQTLFYPAMTEAELKSLAVSPRHLQLLEQLDFRSFMIVPILGRVRIHGAIAFISSRSSEAFTLEDRLIAEEVGRRAGGAVDNARLYAEARRAIESRDRLLSLASQEFSAPVRELRQEIEEALAGEVSREKLLGWEKKVVTLELMLDEFTQGSQLGARSKRSHFESVNLSQLVQDVVKKFRHYAGLIGSRVFAHTGQDLTVEGDSFALQQLLLNLLTVSVKFGAGAPIEITLRAVDNGVELKIQHSLTSEASPYESRFRGITTSRPPTDSQTGLNLYFGEEIARSHNSSIEVLCSPGQSCSYGVTLPTRAKRISSEPETREDSARAPGLVRQDGEAGTPETERRRPEASG